MGIRFALMATLALGIGSWGASLSLGGDQDAGNDEKSQPADVLLAEGDDVLVIMIDGDRLEGTWIGEDESSVVIRIAHVDLRLSNEDVERVIRLEPAIVRYERMRTLIEDDDIERRITLARWLRGHELFAEALRELDEVLEIAPKDGDALRLRQEVNEQMALAQRRIAAAPEDGGEDAEDEGAPEARRLNAQFSLLSDDQINLMKVYEIDLRDPPRLDVPRAVVEQLLAEYSGDPLVPATREGREALFRKSPAEIVELLFRVQARDLYQRVNVIGQPASMKLFRKDVHSTWLMNSCATTRCHGSPGAGRLWLTNRGRNTDRSVYTNFLILDRFRFEDDEPLIDYEHPGRSALLQMGLPHAEARRKHPQVAGWTPVFRSRAARRFRQAEAWVRSMYRPRPKYPIEYTPPGEALEERGAGVER